MKVDSNLDLNPDPQYGFETIRKILPHRYPFLLIDSIQSIEPGERIVAVKNVSGNELLNLEGDQRHGYVNRKIARRDLILHSLDLLLRLGDQLVDFALFLRVRRVCLRGF